MQNQIFFIILISFKINKNIYLQHTRVRGYGWDAGMVGDERAAGDDVGVSEGYKGGGGGESDEGGEGGKDGDADDIICFQLSSP